MLLPLNDALFRSADNRFGLELPAAVLGAMTQECTRRSDMETGGILAGRYDKELRLAKVSLATAPPPDSGGGRAWFRRGTAGLKRLLDQLWTIGDYYLGEWHYHPGASPQPSAQDLEQLRIISSDPRYACPEPVMVILGGQGSNLPLSAHVWARTTLMPLTSTGSS